MDPCKKATKRIGPFRVYQEVGSIKDPNKLTSCQH